jgi:hypothetical protein
MKNTEIQIFRGCDPTEPLDFSKGFHFTYDYCGPQSVAPSGGLNPDALASSKVTGNTVILT